MKKFSVIFSALLMILILLSVIKSASDIKIVTGSKINRTVYSPVINVTGEFVNTEKNYILFSLPLCIKDVYVKENSYVNKGQALFSIDKKKMTDILTGEMPLDLSSLLDSVDINRLKTIKTNFDSDNIINLPDTVYASEKGIVSSLNITAGGFTLPNQRLIEITCTDDIRAKFTLSQADYGKIEIGDTVTIKPIAFSGVSYNGIITDDNAVIKKQNSVVGSKTVVEVFASVLQPDAIIADGLQLTGTVNCGPDTELSVLDYKYINQDENGEYVFVFNNGFAEKVYIETGVETTDYAQVLTCFDDDTIFLCGDIGAQDRVIVVGG